MADAVIIHTSELCLKGDNRHLFEKLLAGNIEAGLADLGDLKVSRQQGSFVLTGDGGIDEAPDGPLAGRLSRIFGLAHFSFAVRCAKDLGAIGAAAAGLAAKSGLSTFKIESRRSDKSFPLTSPEISRQVGGEVLQAVPGIKVDVHDPELTILVEVGPDRAYVSGNRLPGPGGLPSGVSGKVAALLSGGIDSPVAAWKLMRRGCRAVLVHFHSYPYVGPESMDKVKRLAAVLAGWQGGAELHLAPFADIQREIAAKTADPLRVVLYRRMMVRIAEALARRENCLGLVTGDSVGQVASQTLENLAAVTAAAGLPVYRPLIGDDKEEITALAKRIGTYGISIEPHDDCCSVFLPDRPATKTTIARVESEERKFDVAGLVAAALERTEKLAVRPAGAVETAAQ